jgi:predicted acetyltransferase
MTDEIKLIIPTKKHTKRIEQFKSSIANCDCHGIGGLDRYNVPEWLKHCKDMQTGKNLAPGYVSATQYIAIRTSDQKIVGVLQLRHFLNEMLTRRGGNIGYMIAPDERRKGYATQMLNMAMQEGTKRYGITKFLLTCNRDNVASARVIVASGGVLENEIEHDGYILQRYWICLSDKL